MQSTTRKDQFKWPSVNDVADTETYFMFEWDFEVRRFNSNIMQSNAVSRMMY